MTVVSDIEAVQAALEQAKQEALAEEQDTGGSAPAAASGYDVSIQGPTVESNGQISLSLTLTPQETATGVEPPSPGPEPTAGEVPPGQVPAA